MNVESLNVESFPGDSYVSHLEFKTSLNILEHSLRVFINNYTHFSDKDWEKVLPFLEKKTFKKGSLILEEGMICKYIYFLEEGLLRYFVWKNGIDITKFFTEPPYCFTSQRSYNTQQPAEEK